MMVSLLNDINLTRAKKIINIQSLSYQAVESKKEKNKYRKYFIVSPASIVSPLESKPAKMIQLN